MLFYPYEVARVARDTVEVSFPQFPMICAYSHDAETALRHVRESLFAVIAARIQAGLPVPPPAESARVVALPLDLTLKLSLHWERTTRDLEPQDFALELGLDGLEAAFSAAEGDELSPYAARARTLALAEIDARAAALSDSGLASQYRPASAWAKDPG